MRPELLRTLAKFAGSSLLSSAGSTSYNLGSGEEDKIPASSVLRHSVIPHLVAGGIGMGVGSLAGAALPGILESANVLTPEHGAVSGPAAAVGQTGSDNIRYMSPMVGGMIGSAVGQNSVAKSTFMHGIRDAQDARDAAAGSSGPWAGGQDGPWQQGTNSVRIPWSSHNARG